MFAMIVVSRGKTRLSMTAAAIALLGAWIAPAAAGDPAMEARARVQSMWQTVVPILASKGMAPAAREERFRAIYRAHFDNAAIAAAVAGAAWQRATEAERERFLAVFENYVIKVYAGQFGSYNGVRLLVRASEPDGPGAMVTTNIVDAQGEGGRPLELKWRLRPGADGLRIRDVLVQNISMMLQQRREFASVLAQRGGTLNGLSAALSEKMAHLATRN
jgi:phospholipid transport system substrate-binding protein